MDSTGYRYMKNQRVLSKYITRLFRFMLAFGIDRFQILELRNSNIKALVGWPDEGQVHYDPDEETQEILWDIQELDSFEDALYILETAYSKGLFDSDKFLVSEKALFDMVEWDRSRFDQAIKTLLSINVDMLDDGKRSDRFFVHF